ncbi:MAG: hypothetical protein QM675_00795 [Protaetiibacter sp.]
MTTGDGISGGATSGTDSTATDTSDGADSSSTALAGTSWSGTDSDGDFWAFEFQEDGTIAVTFNTDLWDYDTDTWTLTDGNLHISIDLEGGEGTMDGVYTEGATSIDLVGHQSEYDWTVTITPD